MNYKNLLYEEEQGIATITVNRPEALNALNIEVISELEHVFLSINENEAIKVAILTGTGRSFVAGADIAQMRTLDGLEGRAFTMKGQNLMNLIEGIEKPVIAAVNGFALGGGCELAMACDVRFASDKAKFGQPEVNLGIIPGYGATQRLPRLIGKGMAKYLIFGGESINAEQALNIGLVEKVIPHEDLMKKTKAFAELVVKKAPIAVRMAKVAINTGANLDIRSGVAFEAEAYVSAFASKDRIEGMSAFMEKREAVFKNK